MGVLASFSLFAQAASLAAVPFETQFESCGAELRPLVEVSDETLAIHNLNPGQRYVIDLHEHGLDLLVAADQSGLRWINSDPMGYSTEASTVRGDARGEARLRLRVGKLLPWAKLTVIIHCEIRDGDASTAALLGRVEMGELIASAISAGDRRAALRALPMAALALWRSHEPSPDRMWLQFQLAQLAAWGGLGEVSEAWLRLARDEAVLLGDVASEAWASRGIGGALLSRSDMAGDAEFLRAIELADPLGLADISAFAENGRCIFLRVAGDSEAAATCYLATIERFSKMGYSSAEASARISSATALLYLGRYADAVRELDRASALLDGIDDEVVMARVSLIRAQVARWDGDFERALALLGENLELHRRLGRTDDVTRAERQIAQTYELAQEPLRAEHFFRASFVSAEQRGDQSAMNESRVMLAKLDAARGNYEAALDLLTQATESLASSPDNQRYAFGMLQLAGVQRDAGQLSAARATLRKLAAASQTLQWRYQLRFDALRLQLGDAPPDFDAESALAPAAEEALAKGDLMLFLDLSESLLADRERRDERASILALARHAVNAGGRVAARVHSPALRNALLSKLKHFAATPLWALPDGVVGEVSALSAMSDLEALRAIEQQPVVASGGSSDALLELERLLAEADVVKQASSPQRERLILQLASEDAEVKAVERDLPGNVQKEPSATPLPTSMGALLYLVMDGPRAGAMTLDERGWRWRGDLDASMIRDSTSRLRELLRDGYGSRDAIDAEVQGLAAGLKWTTLFERAPAQLSIVLDANLAALPWAMLPAPGEPGKLLVDSSRLLLLQSLRVSQSQPFSSLYLGAAWASGGSGLPALTAAGKEMQRVGALWPSLPHHGLATMSRESLGDALTAQGALVHLAAHGRGDEGRAEDAGLWLADEDAKPAFVSALRLRRLPVVAELIVLAACESGASDSGRSLGVGGVGGSLVDAGAGAVVATRWPVSDRVALAFSESFHRALASKLQSPQAALQSALRELRRAPFARHPTHWAGWFLLRAGPLPDADAARPSNI